MAFRLGSQSDGMLCFKCRPEHPSPRHSFFGSGNMPGRKRKQVNLNQCTQPGRPGPKRLKEVLHFTDWVWERVFNGDDDSKNQDRLSALQAIVRRGISLTTHYIGKRHG